MYILLLTSWFSFIFPGNGNLELFDSESGPDLTLSPQTFTSTAEAFINDNSDSLGVPGDNDTGEFLKTIFQ